jgi:hypothetical protein
MKTDFQEGFLSKLNELSLGNNALDSAACNTDGILSTDTCVSSTHLNRPIWNKMNISPL